MISLSVAKPIIDRLGEANTVAFGLALYSVRFTVFYFLQLSILFVHVVIKRCQYVNGLDDWRFWLENVYNETTAILDVFFIETHGS